MKRNKIILIILLAAILVSCKGYLDPVLYSEHSPEIVYRTRSYVKAIPFAIYSCIPNQTGSNFMIESSDEAEQADNTSSYHKFNNGGWNKYSNPDDVWSDCYKGIRISMDYLHGTDTLTWASWRFSNPAEYADLIKDLCIGRAEARFLSAYLYFELFSRYGDVPLITDKLKVTSDFDLHSLPRESVDKVIDYIGEQCDIVAREGEFFKTAEEMDAMTDDGRYLLPIPYRDTLSMAYPTSGTLSKYLGRATRASAYALKAKALVYYASKLFNPENDVQRWVKAAEACHKVITLDPNNYDLENKYEEIFDRKSNWSKEFLFARKVGVSNSFESANYPICIEKGSTGICPSQNLVDAYEVLSSDKMTASQFDWKNPDHSSNPYANRDHRFYVSIYKHGDQYSNSVNTVILDISNGGNAGPPIYMATKTGYYLKKYVNPSLDLRTNKTDFKTWSLMRMGDFYLLYAEAMNEAYGPVNRAGYTLSALDALNKIRERAGMPVVVTIDQDELREIICHERQVELAFENQRWRDLRRWMYGQYLNVALRGVDIRKSDDNFTYTPMVVEERVFDEAKMYLYPIPASEIDLSKGAITQNPNW